MGIQNPRSFQSICRQWRQYRRLSQLELSLQAEISQRHLSWLETGKSQPSREMVERLSEALEIPLRERNTLLQSAGFAALYAESGLDEPTMAPVLEALNRVLEHHDPLPALVVDRFWNVKKQNNSAGLMFGLSEDSAAMLELASGGGELNLARLTLHPKGLRRYMLNWEQAAPSFARRLRREALATGDAQLQADFDALIELAAIPEIDSTDGPLAPEGLLPVLPLELDINGLRLNLFSVISTFGTPQDITTDELRIEAFYPVDTGTREFFNSLG